MCGIAGWVGRLSEPEQRAARLAVSMRHRGPDAQDVRHWDDACLIHDRLSIIDLTEAGREPMSNEDGSVWSVFNGEIYNHRELRGELEGKGHVFRSRTDGEVIPHLYEEYGPSFVERLHGMFAFAVLDLRRHRLYLARDRAGIKPLFYASIRREGSESLAFASEIRALRTLSEVDCRPNIQALSDFLALSFIPPPQTFFRGISCLEPGHVLRISWSDGEIHVSDHAYHAWTLAPEMDLSLETATQRAAQLLERAVGSQIESDVPLGALLSGGIDSSLVSAYAQKAVDGTLSTFSVQFPDVGFDETPAAKAVARHIHSNHTVLSMIDTDSSWDYVCELLRQPGQPFGDTSIFGVHAVSRLMRKHVTVALSGDGGDEGFGGYPTFSQIQSAVWFQRLPMWAQHAVAMPMQAAGRLGVVPPGAASAAEQLAGANDAGILAYVLSWIRPQEHANIMRGHDTLPVHRFFEPRWNHVLPSTASRLERLSALATEVRTRLILAGDYLPKVDAASMKEGLEVRVPMLDDHLFAYGLTLPHRLKVINGQTKPVLRAVARTQVTPEIANLPKHGFNAPMDRLLSVEVKRRFHTELLGPRSALPQVMDRTGYQPIIEAFSADRQLAGVSRSGLYQRAIMLLAIHLTLTDPGRQHRSDELETGAFKSLSLSV